MNSEIVVIGAGAIGASVGVHLSQMGHDVLVLEKEAEPAIHQSGRNSGVIHPGYNLEPGSLKAWLCVEGSRRLRAYCRERAIPMREGGILVVARTEGELPTLAELFRRGKANGVEVRLVEAADIGHVEPHARGAGALHAPEGASFDAGQYVRCLLRDAQDAGARVRYNTRVFAIREWSSMHGSQKAVHLDTSVGTITTELVVNCAGLQADKLAGSVASDVRVIPFRGYYAELKPHRRDWVLNHIYSAPDLDLPFLGVHFSRQPDGRVIVGPGAMLAFGREAYELTKVNARDLWDIVTWSGFRRLAVQRRFWRLMRTELAKSLFLKAIWQEARLLLPQLQRTDLVRSYAGNRAQLVDTDGTLVEDLLVREAPRALHVLNAVSPGLTCSLPFGEQIAIRCHSKIERKT